MQQKIKSQRPVLVPPVRRVKSRVIPWCVLPPHPRLVQITCSAASQFLSDQRFDDIQELLSDQAFKFAKGFLLEDGTDLNSFRSLAFLKKQLSNFPEQRYWRALDFLPELLPPLEICQARESAGRQL